MLATGVVDAVIADRWVGSYVLAENNIRGVKLIEDPIGRSDSAIAVKKGNTDLLGDINAALADIRQDGTYERIIESWRSKEVVFKTREQLRQQAWLLAAVTVALIAALVCVAALVREIRQRKRVESTLRESEAKYRTLFENMAEEVHFWQLVRDEAGLIKTWRLVDANPPTLIPGAEAQSEEIKGKTTEEIFGPGAADHYIPVVQKIMTEGVPYSFEDYFPNLDKYFRFTSVPLGDYFITTGADITSIKKAEEALRESEAHYRTLFETMTEGFAIDEIICDESGRPYDLRYLDVNPAFERHTGLKAEEIIGHTILELFPQAEPIWFERYGKVALTGAPAHFEACFGPLGKWFEVSTYRIGLNRVAVVFFDTTERKQMEEELRRSEAMLRTVLNQMPSGVTVRDAHTGALILSNVRSREIMGALVDMPGQYAQYLGLHTDGRLYRTEEWPLSRSVATGEAVEAEEIECERADGTRIVLSISSAPVRDSDGRIDMGVGIFHDITERKRAEVALQESESRLAAELAAMKRLHRIGTRFVPNGELGNVLDEVVDAAIAITGSDMGNMQLLDNSGGLTIVAHRGFERPFLDFFNTVHEGPAACGTALKQRQRVIIEDIAESAVFTGSPAREAVLASGARAVQSTPLCSRSGHLLGMLSTHYKTPRRPDERDLLFIDMLSQQIGDMLERMSMEEGLRKSRDKLELRVRERTAELVSANEDLQKQAALLDLSRDAIFVVDSADMVSFWNKGAEDLYGFTKEQAIGNVGCEFLQTRFPESIERVVSQVIDKGRWAGELTQTTSMGKKMVVESRWALRLGEDGKPAGFLQVNRDITSRKIVEERIRKPTGHTGRSVNVTRR